MCSSNGLSIHFCRSILTNRFNLIKATRFDRCQLNFAVCLNTFRIVTNAFRQAGKGSISTTEPQPVSLYMIDKNKDKDAFRILNLLCSKIE
jgi:hypothetical protein